MKTINQVGWLVLMGILLGMSFLSPKNQASSPLKSGKMPNLLSSPSPLESGKMPNLQPSPTPSTPHYRRHSIAVTLTSLADVKVKAGDKINKGDILSDRIPERQSLEVKKQQLEFAIAQIRLPIPEIAALPQPSFEQEKIAIAQAKLKLTQATQDLESYPGLQFKQSWLSEALEPEKLQAIANLEEKQLAASLELQSALARLETAKTNYQQQQYQHSLQVTDYHTRLQHQQYEIASLESQLQSVEEKLKAMVAVRSPYTGRVSRIKVLKQQDHIITAEIIIEIH